MKIQGKQIYSFDNLTVNETIEGKYLISDGEKFALTDEMPCLNANVLRSLLPTYSDHYENFQLRKFGNILPKAKTFFKDTKTIFDTYFENQQQLQEL